MEQLQERFLKKYSNADAVKIVTNSEAAEGIMKGVIATQRYGEEQEEEEELFVKSLFVFNDTMEGPEGILNGVIKIRTLCTTDARTRTHN